VRTSLSPCAWVAQTAVFAMCGSCCPVAKSSPTCSPKNPHTWHNAPSMCEPRSACRTFVILGTSHSIQYKPKDATARERALMDGLESEIRKLVGSHRIRLIAEEGLDGFPLTTARQVAKDEGVRYEQVDISGNNLDTAGIRPEMEARPGVDLQKYGADECRFPRADDIRENLWLEKIGKVGVEPVLVVCGWAHARALSRKVEKRLECPPEVRFFPDWLRPLTIVELCLDAQGVAHAHPRP
jgi:hypothetical protein